MGLFKKKKTNYFFEQFTLVGEYSLRAIKKVNEGLKNFQNIDVEKWKNEVHEIEHEADIIKHETEQRLGKEFMTPIDREDIFLLLDDLDDLTDAIDEISYKLYLRDYHELPDETLFFASLAEKAVISTLDVLKNLNSLTDKKVMDPLIEKVRNIEEEADHMYEEHVHKLYMRITKEDDYKIRLTEKLYGLFEYVTDKCRDVTKTVEIIIYKNL